MARRKKPSACAVKRELRAQGIDFGADFHALSWSKKNLLADGAKQAGYRKSKNASGSTARMFFYCLVRKRGC